MIESTPVIDRSGDLALVMTTFADASIAEQVVRTLVDERLIACGNLIPNVVSLYRWEDGIEREREVVVLLKTVTADVDRVFERMIELHPYTVPELIEVPVHGVNRAYRQWVVESTRVSA